MFAYQIANKWYIIRAKAHTAVMTYSDTCPLETMLTVVQ